jgi:hypothetical protein
MSSLLKPHAVVMSIVLVVSLLILALGVGGIMPPSELVSSAAFSVVFVIVAASVVAAILCKGIAAAVWRGFAVFGASYFTLAVLVGDVWSAANSQLGMAAQPPRPAFVTSYLLAWAYDEMGQPPIWTSGGTRVPAVKLLRIERSPLLSNALDISDFEAFLTTGHCAFTLVIGVLGAVVGSGFYRISQTKTCEPLARG